MAEFPDDVKEMQMTKKGTLNIAWLGSEFGADYVDQRQFFDETYNQNEFIIRTLDTNSAFMSAYSFMIGMYPDTTEGILPDDRIDGQISQSVEGTEQQVDHIRTKFLDLPLVQPQKEKHVRISPGNDKETMFMEDLPLHYSGLQTEILA